MIYSESAICSSTIFPTVSSTYDRLALEACIGTQITSVPAPLHRFYIHPHSSPQKKFPPHAIPACRDLQQLIEYASAVTKKYYQFRLYCQLTDSNTICVSKITANIFHQFWQQFLPHMHHKSQIELHSRGNPAQFCSIAAGVPRHLFPSTREPLNISFHPISAGFPRVSRNSRDPHPRAGLYIALDLSQKCNSASVVETLNK